MRFLILLLACLALATAVPVQAQSIMPLPVSGLQIHSDSVLPSQAGLVGKMQVWLVIDWSLYDDVNRKHPGRDVYWSARWHFERWQTGNQSLFTMAIAANGRFPTKNQDEREYFVKAQDGDSGLVRALVGDGIASALIVVGDDGRIQFLRRHSGDFHPQREELDKLIGPAQQPLIANPADLPPGSAPAMQLLKLGDARGALTLALRQLGPDGRVFATTLAERANERIALETDRIGNPAQPPGHRFLAFRRLEGLLADFPKAPNSAAAVEAMKKVSKDDADLQVEMQAWAALGQYFTQAGRQSPTKLAAFQRQLLTALRERFQNTEGARIAGLILSASRIE